MLSFRFSKSYFGTFNLETKAIQVEFGAQTGITEWRQFPQPDLLLKFVEIELLRGENKRSSLQLSLSLCLKIILCNIETSSHSKNGIAWAVETKWEQKGVGNWCDWWANFEQLGRNEKSDMRRLWQR